MDAINATAAKKSLGMESASLDQRPDLPVGRVHQGLVFGRSDRPLRIAARDNEHVLVMVPVAPDHLAIEGLAGTDRHLQHGARFRDGVDLDHLAKSDVAVIDGFRVVLVLAFHAERRNSETDFYVLWHEFKTEEYYSTLSRADEFGVGLTRTGPRLAPTDPCATGWRA